MRVLHVVVILCMCLLCLSPPLSAAEIANLRTRFFSTHMLIEYDLRGGRGEQDSGVEVLLNINGKRYTSHMLSMSGDFGSSILVGTHRRIIWMHPQDFPAGIDATFRCIVNAVPNRHLIDEAVTPSEGFYSTYYAVSKQTVVETRSKLMWSRNANFFIKPLKHGDAEKLVEKLNHDRYAGYDDWRMPTREDFAGLVSFGKGAGWGTGFAHFIADYLSNCGFTRVQPGNYWTSTLAESAQDQFYVANTWNGIIRPLAGANYYYLWPVRTAR